MLTVHLLTKNNAATIQKALDSVQWADRVLVGDLGSQDQTIAICEAAGAEIHRLGPPRNQARNALISLTTGPTLWLEPWEAVAQGHRTLSELTRPLYATILQHKTMSKEIRTWCEPPQFINPVYERLDINGKESDILLYSTGRTDHEDLLQEIQNWKETAPTAISPYYYEACTLLAIGRWKQFLQVSEHYMFLDKSSSISAVMNRYYYAMVQLLHLKKIRPVLQNLALCLAAKPLMAEFWCLAGDAHYHISKRFDVAKELYENAMILGGKRLRTDKWPMDLAKYKSYPQKMIESCDKILESKSLYIPNRL